MNGAEMTGGSVQPERVRVWDWPTRAFHWSLVLAIGSAWVSAEFAGKLGDPTLKWHRWNGYAILVLLVFRLIWGVVGSSTSRIGGFFHSPSATIGYGLALIRGRTVHYLGHNPLGSVMILLLLAAVTIQAVLGLYTLEHNEITAGPLKRTISDAMTDRVSWLHVRGFNVILALAAIHILANSLYGLVKRDPLVKAMITGRKPAKPFVDAPEMQPAGRLGLRAALSLLCAIVIVFGGITLLGGRIL
jgi:cytochrome b